MRVHEKLLAAGVSLSYPALTAFCGRHGITTPLKVAAGRYEHSPGQEVQHDTSPHWVAMRGTTVRVQTVSNELPYLRSQSHARQEQPLAWRIDRARMYEAWTLEIFPRAPGTLGKVRPADRRLAGELYDHKVPLAIVRAAICLAAARRASRPVGAQSLVPIRSLDDNPPQRASGADDGVDPGVVDLFHLNPHFASSILR